MKREFDLICPPPSEKKAEKAADTRPIAEALGMVTKVLSTHGGGAILILAPLPPVNLNAPASKTLSLHLLQDGSVWAIRQVEELKVVIPNWLMPNEPHKGEILQITGKLENRPPHGEQVFVTGFGRELPVDAQIVPFIALNPRFSGIQELTANNLWQDFGTGLHDILNRGDVDALTDRQRGKLPYKVALNLCAVWEAYTDEKPVLQFLQKLDLPRRLATQIREFYGKKAVEKLTEDPYRLLAFAPWRLVDKIAREKFGIKKDDPRRQAAAMEAVLYMHYDRGHTAVTRADLRRDMHKKLGDWVDPDTIYDTWKDRAVELVNQGLFQSAGAYAMEEHICRRINSMVQGDCPQQSLFKPVFEPSRLAAFETANQMLLNQGQQEAVKLVLGNQVSYILGPAGTGKTTIVKAIRDQLGPQANIFLVALTGRAANVLRVATGDSNAMTCVKFLNHAYSHGLPDDTWLFVDESSMLDAPITYRMLDVLPPSANVCFMGDHYQLAGIGPGLFLHQVAWSNTFKNKVELSEIVRQKQETGIPQAAQAIRNRLLKANDLDSFVRLADKDFGVSFIQANTQDEILKQVLKVYRQCRNLGDVQIVAARNATCDLINKALHEETMAFRKHKGLRSPVLGGATIDEPLLHHSRNDYSRMVFNGSIGILKAIYDQPRWGMNAAGEPIRNVALAEFDDAGLVQLAYDDFDFIKLGYAVSLHKAQGSQFLRVIVVSEYAPMVDNSWFYTALTRAQVQVIVIGSQALFDDRVSKVPNSFNRCTGMYL